MEQTIAFLILSIPVVLLSLQSMRNKKSHGFYRFFSWEAMLVLLVFKIKYWFTDPFSLHQILSWIFLFSSLALVISGVIMLKKKGKQKSGRDSENLFAFEKTSELVQSGIYRYIRHPLYSSLLFLNWGIYLKQPDLILFHVAILASLFLYLTASADEQECIHFFGTAYKEYMKKTKRFIPFVF